MFKLPQIISQKNISPSDISIIIEKESTRVIDKSLETQAHLNWNVIQNEAREKGLPQTNGIHYRLNNLDEVMNGELNFKLSTIEYKYIRGYREIIANDKTFPKEMFMNHIGTGALLKTSDGYYVFGQRGKKLNIQSPIDVIGGGLQVDEIEVNTGYDLYRNALKEMREEIGVSENYIVNQPEIICIVISPSTNIILLFDIRLSCTSNALKNIFSERLDDEMNELILVREDKIKEFTLSQSGYRQLLSQLF